MRSSCIMKNVGMKAERREKGRGVGGSQRRKTEVDRLGYQTRGAKNIFFCAICGLFSNCVSWLGSLARVIQGCFGGELPLCLWFIPWSEQVAVALGKLSRLVLSCVSSKVEVQESSRLLAYGE